MQILSVLGDAAAANSNVLQDREQIEAVFDLLMTVFPCESLLVSIPVLHTITKLIESKRPQFAAMIDYTMAAMLETCSQRLLKYESLPKDCGLAIVAYLQEDFETLPEQHAFLGNYRRYCTTVIDSIARTRPQEALQHILQQTAAMIRETLSANGQCQACNSGQVIASKD